MAERAERPQDAIRCKKSKAVVFLAATVLVAGWGFLQAGVVRVTVPVPSRAVSALSVLGPQDLESREFDEDDVQGAVREARDLVGRLVVADLGRREPVRKSALVSAPLCDLLSAGPPAGGDAGPPEKTTMVADVAVVLPLATPLSTSVRPGERVALLRDGLTRPDPAVFLRGVEPADPVSETRAVAYAEFLVEEGDLELYPGTQPWTVATASDVC